MVIGNDCADIAVEETFTFRFSIFHFIASSNNNAIIFLLHVVSELQGKFAPFFIKLVLSVFKQSVGLSKILWRFFYNAIEWPIWRLFGQRPTSKWTSITCRNVSHSPQIAIDFFLVCFSSVVNIAAAAVGFSMSEFTIHARNKCCRSLHESWWWQRARLWWTEENDERQQSSGDDYDSPTSCWMGAQGRVGKKFPFNYIF